MYEDWCGCSEVKLWYKDVDVDKQVEAFTVGNDYLLDLVLIPYDCKASMAHAKMLHKSGVLTKNELDDLLAGLKEILNLHKTGAFIIQQKDEDCHTAIENYLVSKMGDAGKKIHTARSRNDQVLAAIRLYEKDALQQIALLVQGFQNVLGDAIKKWGTLGMPGYTHMRKAMPTTVGVWLGCFHQMMGDNKLVIESVTKIIDKNPLGTGAGFGIPVFDIDQEMTSKELGFGEAFDNPLAAQMSRGKYEGMVAHALVEVMSDLNKLSQDLILFSMVEFGYVDLPEEICTGSSIMPQKKNPDVLELARAKYGVVLAEEFKIRSIVSNLMSGYNRDIQLTKEPLFKIVETVKETLSIMGFVVGKMKINEVSCKNAMTEEMYTTEEAYKLVKKGMPFRDAYREIAKKLG